MRLFSQINLWQWHITWHISVVSGPTPGLPSSCLWMTLFWLAVPLLAYCSCFIRWRDNHIYFFFLMPQLGRIPFNKVDRYRAFKSSLTCHNFFFLQSCLFCSCSEGHAPNMINSPLLLLTSTVTSWCYTEKAHGKGKLLRRELGNSAWCGRNLKYFFIK